MKLDLGSGGRPDPKWAPLQKVHDLCDVGPGPVSVRAPPVTDRHAYPALDALVLAP